MRYSTPLVVPFCLLAGACGLFGRAGVAGAPDPASARGSVAVPGAAAAAASGLTDANIAAIVVAANTADVLYADLALAKSRDSVVRTFANMVKKDHESINEAAVALVTRLRVIPVDVQISFDLRDDAETKRSIFRDLEGAAFDSAYAANEVSYHTSVLGVIDGALIPSARNVELRALLVDVRPAVAAHLEHAIAMAAKKSVRHEVQMRANSFAPAELVVSVGDTIDWRNADIVRHSAVRLGGFESGELRSGEHYAWVPSDTGTFSYGCSIHSQMKGRIVVR